MNIGVHVSFFPLFSAVPVTYGSSQSRNSTWVTSVTYITAASTLCQARDGIGNTTETSQIIKSTVERELPAYIFFFFFFSFFGHSMAYGISGPGIRSKRQLQQPDPQPTVSGRGSNLCPSNPKMLPTLLGHSGTPCMYLFELEISLDLCPRVGLLDHMVSSIFSWFSFLCSFFFLCVCLFDISWAAPAAYGGPQARGPIRAAAASLRQSHSNAGSSRICNLHHSSRQCRILSSLSKGRDQTRNLMVPSRIC